MGRNRAQTAATAGSRLSTAAAGSNTHWARLIVEELIRCGVTTAVLAPGSRSTPLVLALAGHHAMQTTVCHDERGAAFRALGHARASGTPAVVICTSGTAVANVLPAVVEASSDYQPLLIISADRPSELLDTGANQTIQQSGIFSGYVRWQADLPAPTPLVHGSVVLTTIDQAVHQARTAPAGPVHLNCQFREPLETEPMSPLLAAGGERWQAHAQPYTRYHASALCWRPDPALLATLADSDHGLLVAGRGVGASATALEELAAVLDWPFLADVSSGARGTAGLQLLLQTPAGRRMLAADTVLQFGATPTAKGFQLLLQDAPPPRYLQVSETPDRLDPTHLVSERIPAAPAAVAQALVQELGAIAKSTARSAASASARAAALRRRGAAARTAANALLDASGLSEPVTAQLVSAFAERPVGLFLASSMPVRDVDTFATPLAVDLPRAANRGASGIDGTIASAAGYAAGLACPVLVLLGDLALIHDLNSLGQLSEAEHALVVVVINNRGGGIFSLLPVAQSADPAIFERYFAAPHQVAFEPVAAAFGLGYAQPRDRSELQRALTAAYATARKGRSSLLEVRTERTANAHLHQQLQRVVEMAITQTPGDG